MASKNKEFFKHMFHRSEFKKKIQQQQQQRNYIDCGCCGIFKNYRLNAIHMQRYCQSCKHACIHFQSQVHSFSHYVAFGLNIS